MSKVRGHTRVVEIVDTARLRQVYGAFPTGVTALAALIDGRPAGLAASSFNSVSLDPPLVSVAIAHTSTTWPLIRSAPRFGVSVLSTEQEAVSRQLAASTGDRFAGLRWRGTDAGAVVLDDATAWLDCSIHEVVRAGDHDLLLLRVHDLGVHPDRPPLVFHASQYRRLDRTSGVAPAAGGHPEDMSEPQDQTESTSSRDAAGLPKDDERATRDSIDQTGEPETDALGNADGAS